MHNAKKHWVDQLDRRMVLFVVVYFSFLISMGVMVYSLGANQIRQAALQNKNMPVENYQAPRLDINVASVITSMGSVKMEMSLKVASRDSERLKSYMPKILDRIHTCVSRSSVEEIRDANRFGFFRSNLLREINLVSGPVKILDIYVTKLLTS